MNVLIIVFLLNFNDLINIKSVEKNLLLMGILCWCKSIAINIHETMIKILESLLISFPSLDMYDKKIPITINKLKRPRFTLTSRHKTKHLNKSSRLETLGVFFWQFAPSIQCHFWYLVILLRKKVHIIHFDSMIGFIKRQYTWLELLWSLHCSQHWIDYLVIKWLSDIKLNNQLCLI